MSRILKYSSSSDLMNIKITYGEEEFSFNLYSELILDENKINSEIKEQPSAYAFLSMLHKKLYRTMKDAEKSMEKCYSDLYIMYKSKTDENTNRPMANEVAREKTNAHAKYQGHVKRFLEAEHNTQILEVCVKSFEQRQMLIQTLSANIRKG